MTETTVNTKQEADAVRERNRHIFFKDYNDPEWDKINFDQIAMDLTRIVDFFRDLSCGRLVDGTLSDFPDFDFEKIFGYQLSLTQTLVSGATRWAKCNGINPDEYLDPSRAIRNAGADDPLISS